MDELILTATNEIYFSTRSEVPIADVVASLQAFERIVKHLPQVLTGLTGAEIEDIQVFVDELESGSLFEKYLLKLVFKDEQELEKFLASVREKLREKPMMRNVIIGSAIAGLVGYGLYVGAQVVRSPEAAKTIQANNNVIINIGAGEMNITPEQFTAIVQAAVHDKRGLAKDSIKLMSPARTDKGSTVTFDGNDQLVIQKETVQAAPSSIDVPKAQLEESLPDVDLHIRATNLDSNTQGWAGLITGVVDRRIPIELAEEVDPKDVASRFKVRADVVVVYEPKGKAKKLTPVRIIVTSVIQQ